MAPSGTPKETSKEATATLDLADTTSSPHKETTQKPPCEEPRISIHALLGIIAPEILKLIGYIKTQKGGCLN
jgi:hypothetical protein